MINRRPSEPGYVLAYHCDGSIEQIRIPDSEDTADITRQLLEEAHGKWADGSPANQQLITFEEDV